MHPRSAAAVAIGGALGAGLRWGLLELFQDSSTSWAWGVFVANVVGCAALGFIVAGPAKLMDAHTVTGLTAGFCGGLTTFSGFAFDAAMLLRSEDWWLFATYLVGSVLSGIAAFLAARHLGHTVSKVMVR